MKGKLKFSDDALTSPLGKGLRELLTHYPEQFGGSEEVRFRRSQGDTAAHHYQITQGAGAWEIAYDTPAAAWRGLGHLMSTGAPASESTGFQRIGMMLDVSRNAVIRVERLRELIGQYALLGISTLYLYMEDVYELKDEPFFGCGRGRYSREELRQIDGFAAQFEIEVVPAIQTLGHLEQLFRWEAYRPIQDRDGVLLAGDPDSYRLIGKMLYSVQASFRTKRVHIGMDEAFGMGLGKYREQHGDVDRFEIFNRHLKQVAALCTGRGLSPMIWSDMYFRIGSPGHDYYDPSSVIPAEAAASIPPSVQFVYWDYYHFEETFYEEWISRHRKLGKEPILAVGAWTWGRFWARLPYAIETMTPAIRSARNAGLEEVMLTHWGDDGTECNPGSALAAVAAFGELVWNPDALPEPEKRLLGVTGESWPQSWSKRRSTV